VLTGWWKRYGDLAALFFLHGMAMGMWFVPLGTVLDAHGLQGIKPFAFGTAAVASFFSPLLFGAISDRHLGPVRVLRGLALATAAAMALAAMAIGHGWPAWLVLTCIQAHALCSSPTWSISSTIVFSGLENASKEFGPIRAMGTLGWVAGCWVVSALGADTSPVAGYAGAVLWLVVFAYTFVLPQVKLKKTEERLSLRQRFGLDALVLLRQPDHRVVFITAALFSIPLAAFYPFTPTHLRQLGLVHTTAWMTVGQATEIAAMLGLGRLLGMWRLKWIFATGLAFGLLRYALCTFDGMMPVLAGVFLHGFAFTLFYITAQIYLEERVETTWRGRAQALMYLMNGGVGNLCGYLGTGAWLEVCRGPDGLVRWPKFWGGLAVVVAVVLGSFLLAYRGQRHGGVMGAPAAPAK
jgi:MFS family permease